MAEKSNLLLTFRSRNKRLVVPKNTPPNELREKVVQKFDLLTSQPFKLLVVPVGFPSDKLAEKAAQKFDISQPFILESYDETFNDWIEVDPDDDEFELPATGIAKILVHEEQVVTPPVQTVKPTELAVKPTEQTVEPMEVGTSKSTPASDTVATNDSQESKISQPQGENQTNVTDGEDLKYPICDSAPEVAPKGGVSSTQTGAAAAQVKKGKIWEGRQQLSVYFMNPDDIDDWGWRCRGEPMNINTIFAWARVWNFVEYPEIPSFELAELPKRADIRVQFSKTGGNWSMVGMEATEVTDLKKPTMQLNLGGHTPDLQESLVVHEFGHALGLEHEHQSSDFWDVVGEFLDVEKMKKDPQVSTAFEKQWARKASTGSEEPSVNSLSEYDPESIMHYKFDIKWISNEVLRTYENIDKTDSLDKKEKKYLKALHERSKKGQLSKRPTISDYRVLVQAYGRVFDENSKNLRKLREHLVAPDRKIVDTKKVLRVNTHLRAIRNTVWPARAEWRNLGAELLITPGTLDAIDMDRRNVGDKLGAVLEKWMYTGKATVNQLISALDSVSVLRKDLADELSAHEDMPDAAQYGF